MFGSNRTSSYVSPTNPNGSWAEVTGSDDGPEVWSVTGYYPFKKAVGFYNKGFTAAIIPIVTLGDVSSQTVNTPGPFQLIFTLLQSRFVRRIARG
ncbi:hypothetical protein GCM10022249_19250 [Enteractinococcus coprophilus]